MDGRAGAGERAREGAVAAGFAALALLFCARFLWPGRTLMPVDLLLIMGPWRELRAAFPGFEQVYNPMLDPVQQYLPWQHLWAQMTREGIVPLWNPYAFAGTPFLANLQSAVFYPGKALFLLLPPAMAFGWTAWLHLALASWFMYLFVRALGAGRTGGVVAGIAYAYSGYAIGWIAFPTLGQWVSTWLPLLLYCFERAVQTRRWAWAVGAAAVVGVQFLGGHLQVSFYVLAAFAAYAVVRVARAPRHDRLFAAGAALAALVVGGLLAAVQLLPTLELAGISPRAVRPLPDLLAHAAVPWGHLVAFIVPNFFGNPVDYNYWGDLQQRAGFNFLESGMYAGVFTLALAVWAVYRRRPGSGWGAGLVVAAVLMATGSPLFVAVYHLVPGFDQLGGLGRVLVLACFGLAVLAGLGVDDLVRAPHRRALFVMLVTSGALAVGVGAALARYLDWWPGLAGYTLRQLVIAGIVLAGGVILVALRQRQTLGPRAFGCAMAGLLIADVFFFGVRFPPAAPAALAFPGSPVTQHLRRTLGDGRLVSTGADFRQWFPPNTPTAYGLSDVQGSDSLWWAPYARLLRTAHPDAPTPALDVTAPVLDRLSVTRLASGSPVTHPKWRLEARTEAMHIYANTAARPRAFTTRRAQQVHSAALTEWLRRIPWTDGVAVAQAQALDDRGSALFDPGVQPAASLRITPHEVTFTADAGDRPALAVLADPLYPGWRVTVDGAAADALPVDWALRGVLVPQGRHDIIWKFQPGSYVAGLYLSAVGLLLVTAQLVAAGGRRVA